MDVSLVLPEDARLPSSRPRHAGNIGVLTALYQRNRAMGGGEALRRSVLEGRKQQEAHHDFHPDQDTLATSSEKPSDGWRMTRGAEAPCAGKGMFSLEVKKG